MNGEVGKGEEHLGKMMNSDNEEREREKKERKEGFHGFLSSGSERDGFCTK